jgi:hypothetical protein
MAGWLWDYFEPLRINEKHIDGPNRVEDQSHLGEIKTFNQR